MTPAVNESLQFCDLCFAGIDYLINVISQHVYYEFRNSCIAVLDTAAPQNWFKSKSVSYPLVTVQGSGEAIVNGLH